MAKSQKACNQSVLDPVTTQNKIYNTCRVCCVRQWKRTRVCTCCVIWTTLNAPIDSILEAAETPLRNGRCSFNHPVNFVMLCVSSLSHKRRTWIELLRQPGKVQNRVHSDHPDRFDSFIKSTQVNYKQLQSEAHLEACGPSHVLALAVNNGWSLLESSWTRRLLSWFLKQCLN